MRLHPSTCLSGVLLLALAGCGAADAGPPPALPSAPPLASTPERPADPPGLLGQTFADTDPEYAFQDPDRRKKLATAFAQFDAIAEDELKRLGLPSLAIGVVIDGELAYEKGFGAADLASGRKPDADTVYRIGSITKSFTAAAILSLRDQGALSLDDPLARWVPEASGLVYPTRDTPHLTIRQLLTHTSGLPRDASKLLFQTERAPTEADYLKELAGVRLDNPPGTRFQYSNLGFGLLGVVASRAAHVPYRELVNQRVLTPLGMTSTVWDRASVPAGRLATAYTKGPDGKPKAVEHWLIGAYEGAGGLYSSVRDMARYLAFQLTAYPPRNAPDNGPLRRSSVREGHKSALWSSLSVHLADAPREGESLVKAEAHRYGYGWGAEQTCEHDERIGHDGGTEGYSTHVSFLPEQGVGVIALSNVNRANLDVGVRLLAELQKTGGLSKRTPKPSPAFAPVMKKLLDVQNHWDEATYKSMLTAGRMALMTEEKQELEGYRALHGTCKGYSPIRAESPTRVLFKVDCERGSFEMIVGLGSDGLIEGFGGTSRDLEVPPELRKVGERVAGLIKKWDEGVYKKHLASAGKPRDKARKLFEAQRAAHGACTVKGLVVTWEKKQLELSCERGGDLLLTLKVDPQKADMVSAYDVEGVKPQGTCPVR